MADINWDEVDKLAIAGCNGRRIAGFLGIHEDTLYRKVYNDKGIGFTDYIRSMHSKGEALLEAAQFYKALDKQKKGDTQLLIHLGKHRLGQVDKTENDTTITFVEYDPTKRDTDTDTVQISDEAIPGPSLDSAESGLQESGPMLA